MAKLSTEHRRKIGTKKEEEAIERLGSLDHRAITHKICTKCGKTKPVSDFATRKEKRKCGLIYVYPEPGCKKCRRVQREEWEERKRAEGVDLAAYQRKNYGNLSKAAHKRRRKRQQEWSAAKRRQEGRPARRFKKSNAGTSRRIPVGPIAAFLTERAEAGESKAEVAAATGINERVIFAIMAEDSERVSLAIVDRLLVGLGCQDDMLVLYPVVPETEKLVGYHVLDPDGILESVEA